jgi:hypothetical protein
MLVGLALRVSFQNGFDGIYRSGRRPVWIKVPQSGERRGAAGAEREVEQMITRSVPVSFSHNVWFATLQQYSN